MTKRKYFPEIETPASHFPRFDIANPGTARAQEQAMLDALAAKGVQRPADDRIEEIEQLIPGPEGAPDVPIRIYMPKDRAANAAPVFLNFHLGGWMLGSLESEHPRCLMMSAKCGAVSIGVDYRLAPEHPFPAGVEDCYAALKWVSEHAEELNIDPTRIAVGGGSAGGNLAAAVSLMARDRGGPEIAFQMLFYPVLDDRCNTESMKAGTDTYIWTYQNMLDAWDHYIGKDRSDVSPYASPARADDISNLPPAYIMTCEHDPLRDEAIQYAMRLMTAGVQVELHNYPGTVHAFDLMPPCDVSTQALSDSLNAFAQRMDGRLG